MRIEMLATMAGPQGTAAAGSVVDVPEPRARELIAGKYAREAPKQAAPPPAAPAVETAAMDPEAQAPERAATTRAPKGRGRGGRRTEATDPADGEPARPVGRPI